ncbi:MAG: HDOD domain-containing protein [bacterium]
MIAEMNPTALQERRKKSEMVLANIYNLPAMAGVMMEVSRLLDDPSTNTGSLSKMIGRDQGLATKILAIANSPLYGLPRKVSTIDFAILIIGFQDIKNIVIALSMIESFKNKTDKNLDQKEFWQHSVMTGNASKRVAQDLGYRFGSEAFVAGLLHDLGIPVIHKYFHTSFGSIVNSVKTNGLTFNDAELEHLGLTHMDIGRFLAEKWNLPDNLCEAIQLHHVPSRTQLDEVLAAVVHLVDYMTVKFQLGNFYWDDNYILDESIFKTLKFSGQGEMEKFIEPYKNLFIEELNTIRI